ncbi:MAG TPA: histidine triad nucleotide-binding protein [Candidatus Limnocylindria bacterium]
MSECVFCRIVSGEIPAKVLYRDDHAVAISDLSPKAPFHALVMPRAHVAKLSELEDTALGGQLLQAVRRVAREAGFADEFRMVVNNGESAGQSVWHLHIHVLGGRDFGWPPG